ncbi:MAG: radical SAM protein [bacterium]
METLLSTKPSNNSLRDNPHIFGTYEWACQNANFIDGCQHDCKYCYSKEMAIRFGRRTPDNWKNAIVKENNLNKKFKKVSGTIMFPSSHDIHPDNLDEAIKFLQNIVVENNKVLIVTKPHLMCISTICKEFKDYKKQILFRFTIGSISTRILKFWEPGAPSFSERFKSLQLAYKKGFKTSVSCEPLLDKSPTLLVKKVLPFITDSIWIGKPNYFLRRLKLNGYRDRNTILKATQLLDYYSESKVKLWYSHLKNNSKIRWKESLKKILDIELSSAKGLDI